MKERAKSVLLFTAALMLLGIAYILFNLSTGIGIPCLFHSLTGYSCPGCGVSRMIISILKFDFLSAVHYNAALLFLSPAILVLAVQLIYKYIKTGSKMLSRAQSVTVVVIIVILILFSVIRNLPGFEYLR